MKRHIRQLLGLVICLALIISNFSGYVAFAANSNVYELTFDNLFVFEEWANTANSAVVTPGTPGEMTIDIETGTFNLVNTSTTAVETYTAFGSTISGYYYIDVEPDTQYTFSFSVERTETNATQNMESFVFFYDERGALLNEQWVSYNPIHYGMSEWNFTTPSNAHYIQVRFDNNWPDSQAKVSDIRICKSSVYEYSKDNTLRKTYTYSAGATYGELPAPQRDGLVFGGWFTEPDGNGTQITADTAIAQSSYSLYSHWTSISVSKLEIVSSPINQTYYLGEKLDTRGLVLGVTYPDGTSENIDEGFSYSPEYLTETGTQTVTVTYGDKTTSFNVEVSSCGVANVLLNGNETQTEVANNTYTLNYTSSAFNRFVIEYSSDAYVKGEINFNGTVEEFFLEPAENGVFTSYIDSFLDGTIQTKITSISFTPLDKDFMDFTLHSVSTSQETNISYDYGMVYLSDAYYKIGIDLDWGGALTYMEDLTNDIVAAQKNVYYGTNTNSVEVGPSSDFTGNFLTKYNTVGNVNLINAHDTGRLVQQAYYGAGDSTYEPGMFEGAAWPYNPVQGGNLYNEPSKIVDFKVTDNEIYIKCRALDWAKEAQYITPSYMEAWYTLDNGILKTTCRFVDYSGYPSLVTNQEIPAFYCVEPLNNFVYYSGGEAWSDSNSQVTRSDLIFWSGRDDQNFECNENWGAFISDASSGYGIGVYSPGQTNFCAGVMEKNTLKSLEDENMTDDLIPGQPAANHNSTSYIGVMGSVCFESYSPIAYSYYITTGNVNTIRETFRPLALKEEDQCNATNTNGFCDRCGKYVAPELSTDKYDIDDNGTMDSVYEIGTAGELFWFSNYVNSGNATANAIVTADIVVNENLFADDGSITSPASFIWSPIGNGSAPYNGIFHGQGHTISGLYYNNSEADYGGLFGNVGSAGVIREVGITDSYIFVNSYSGAIAGNNAGTITNCYATRSFMGANIGAGGIAGANSKSISTCYTTAFAYAQNYVGAVCGYNTADIYNCYYLENNSATTELTVQNGIGGASSTGVTDDTDGVTIAKTLSEFHSGEVAYLLQKANSSQIWGQKSNAENSAPMFDYTGKYKVTPVTGVDCYSVCFVGDIVSDGNIDIQDYQSQVNMTVSQTIPNDNISALLRADLNADGYIDALDCSVLALMRNGLTDGIGIYPVGDFDCDGVSYTETDIAAIKKGLINQDTLSTRQKYSCDLNSDGVLDINDKDILVAQEETLSKPIFLKLL